MQRLPADAPPTFVTLNPPQAPEPGKTIRRLQLAHPVFTYAAYEAQQKLPAVQVTLLSWPSSASLSCSLGPYRQTSQHSSECLVATNVGKPAHWVPCGNRAAARMVPHFMLDSLVMALQGKGSLYYAGAWCGYGFHEDGLKAGMAAAVALGASIPWVARPTCPKIGLTDSFFLGTFDRFARMALKMGSLRLILPNGEERCYGSEQPLSVPGRSLGHCMLQTEFCQLAQWLQMRAAVQSWGMPHNLPSKQAFWRCAYVLSI